MDSCVFCQIAPTASRYPNKPIAKIKNTAIIERIFHILLGYLNHNGKNVENIIEYIIVILYSSNLLYHWKFHSNHISMPIIEVNLREFGLLNNIDFLN